MPPVKARKGETSLDAMVREGYITKAEADWRRASIDAWLQGKPQPRQSDSLGRVLVWDTSTERN